MTSLRSSETISLRSKCWPTIWKFPPYREIELLDPSLDPVYQCCFEIAVWEFVVLECRKHSLLQSKIFNFMADYSRFRL